MKQHQDISDKWYGRNGKDKRTGSDYLTTIGVKANYSEMWLTPVTGPLRLCWLYCIRQIFDGSKSTSAQLTLFSQ